MKIIDVAGDSNRIKLADLYTALPGVEWDAVLHALKDEKYFSETTMSGEAAVLIHPQARYDYRQYLRLHDERAYKNRRIVRDEVRGWITTIIAALAFLLSLISLTWQIATWMQGKEESKEPQSIAAATTVQGVESSSPPP